MRELRITSLQWSVGVFCVVLGLLILVVSQQLNAPALAALQPYRLELGCWLTLSGLALLVAVGLPLLLLHLGPPAAPALARAIHMLFAVGLVGAVLALRPDSGWVGVAMAAVGGTAVALVAWPQPPWLGWHPTSLRARLA